MQKILSALRRAVNDFNMIEEGDKIVVGLSGGKDSIVLVSALKEFQRFSPARFELEAVTIDIGFSGVDQTEVERTVDYLKK